MREAGGVDQTVARMAQQVGEEDFLAHSTDLYVISSGNNLIDTSTNHFLSTF